MSGSRSTRYYRQFRCPTCGTEMVAPKMRKTAKGHIKTMWCWKCRDMRDFVQVEEGRFNEELRREKAAGTS